MWPKLIAFIFAMLLTLFSNSAFAQSAPAVSADSNVAAVTAVVTPLRSGQPAPFSGVLYSPAAAAQVIADRNAVPQQIKIEVDKAVGTIRAQDQFKIDLAAASLEASNKIATATYTAKDAQIKAAEAALDAERAQHKNDTWKIFGGVAGGFAVGAIVTVAIVFGVNQVK